LVAALPSFPYPLTFLTFLTFLTLLGYPLTGLFLFVSIGRKQFYSSVRAWFYEHVVPLLEYEKKDALRIGTLESVIRGLMDHPAIPGKGRQVSRSKLENAGDVY
jgi:hypothetical protein